MRKSVFTRYITVFMLIIFISFTILTLVICSNMSMITLEGKGDDVKRASETVSEMLTELGKPESSENFFNYIDDRKSSVTDYISYLADFSENLSIYVFDTDGNMLIAAGSQGESIFTSGIDAERLEKLMQSEPIEGFDDMDGILVDRYLYHGVPVYNSDRSSVVGAVFACSSSKGVSVLIINTVKTMALASLWVFLAALIAVYFLSERIIGPLKDMSRAAKQYASGKFDVRIPVSGNDEVAELATAFNQMATGLQSLEDMRSSFLANVSHDLKTPMTTIAGFIDAILSGAIPQENQSEYLERIKNEVLRLSRLVRQLLDLSRIQAGDRKFEPVTFDICEVARQIVLSFEQKIDEKHLDVEFNCEAERIKVVADKDAIHQILYNICDNAVKFSRPGGKYRIDIATKDKKVHVSVYNEGQGISKEDLPFVFERFYKSDKSRGLDKTGVGLGLYIAKTIIDAHGETITVDSEQGVYCRFEFTLQPADNKKSMIDKVPVKD